LSQLQQASESRVYADVHVARVTGFAQTTTPLHLVSHFNVTLGSPSFLSRAPEESFSWAVMRDVHTGRRTVAVDEFPRMLPEAVETAWRRRVANDAAARQLLLMRGDD